MQTYCERCGPGLFDEPINATSNIVFLLAAFFAWHALPRRAMPDGRESRVVPSRLAVLMGLSVCVGVGSALWHTFATSWALVLDIVPILVFQLCFLWLYGRQVVGLHWATAVTLLTCYVGLGLWLREYRDWLNGVLIYAPAVVLSWTVGVHWWLTRRSERFLLLTSAGVFCVALTARTIDLLVCRQFPIGTHFLWHVLNGWVLYAAMRAVVLTLAVASTIPGELMGGPPHLEIAGPGAAPDPAA